MHSTYLHVRSISLAARQRISNPIRKSAISAAHNLHSRAAEPSLAATIPHRLRKGGVALQPRGESKHVKSGEVSAQRGILPYKNQPRLFISVIHLGYSLFLLRHASLFHSIIRCTASNPWGYYAISAEDCTNDMSARGGFRP